MPIYKKINPPKQKSNQKNCWELTKGEEENGEINVQCRRSSGGVGN